MDKRSSLVRKGNEEKKFYNVDTRMAPSSTVMKIKIILGSSLLVRNNLAYSVTLPLVSVT
jgi:hypothetical protein